MAGERFCVKKVILTEERLSNGRKTFQLKKGIPMEEKDSDCR